jgi:hypothetical protein
LRSPLRLLITLLAGGTVNAADEVVEPAASKSPANPIAITAFCMTVSPLAMRCLICADAVFLSADLNQCADPAIGSAARRAQSSAMAVRTMAAIRDRPLYSYTKLTSPPDIRRVVSIR